MKKILLALFVLAIAAAPGLAATGVAIQWDTQWGAYTDTAVDLTGTDYLLDSYSLVWQLIYAGADDQIDIPSTATGGANGDYVTDDDVVWASRVFSVGNGNASDGTTWTTDLFYAGTGDRQYMDSTYLTADSYIYQRILQDTPAVGSWYYDSALELIEISPTTFQESYLDAAGGGTSGVQPNQQIIPEPATMGLLGLGALVMAIRRRRS